MFRIALKGILARKGRLLLTSFAVVLGTAFLCGSFVFTDTIQKTFDDLFADVNANTDAFVRSATVIEGDFGAETRNRIPIDLVDTIRTVPGVQIAEPAIQGAAVIFDREGKPLTVSGPTFGGNAQDLAVTPWVYAEGGPPVGENQVVIDMGSAKKEHYKVGEPVRINGAGGTRDFTLSGIVKFGTVDSPGGASYALFDLPTARSFLLPQRDAAANVADAVIVKSDGSISDEELVSRIMSTVDDDQIEALTGAEITAENQSKIRQALKFFTIFLTVFALVALFVGSFVIANMFSITQAQRQRENALLRAIGATSRQVSTSAFVEAAAIGVVGSLIGVVAGVGLAAALKALLGAFGVDIPSVGLTFLPRTFVVTMLVGLLITVLAAVFPSLRAGRIRPVEAMRSSAFETTGSNHRRFVVGMIALAIGVVCIAIGLFGGEPLLFGIGAPVLFISLYVLLPLIARPVTNVIGRPIAATRGISGRLAVQNSSRSPRRTARTAAALMIGVALVAGVQVTAASIRASVRDVFGKQFTGDYAVTLQRDGGGPVVFGFNNEFTDSLNSIEGVEAAAGINVLPATVDGKAKRQLTVVNPETVGKVFDLKFEAGNIEDLTSDGVVISRKRADKDQLAIGSTVTVDFGDGTAHALTVQGIYSEDVLAGSYTVSRALLQNTAIPLPDFVIFVKRAAGASDADVTQRLDDAVKANGLGELKTKTEYIDDQAAQVNQLVNLVNGLLGLSVFIAILGIGATLSLSVLERRRELALSRAVGMSRAQVRTMVRWEAVITAVLGTVVGVVVGLLLGYALVAALRSQGFTKFSIPVGAILVMLVLAMAIGTVAAFVPARRATRVNVVESLAST